MHKKARWGGAPADPSASGPLPAKAEITGSGRRGGIGPGSHLGKYSSRAEDKIRRLLLGPRLQPDGDFALLIVADDLQPYCVADGVIVKPAQEPRDAVDRRPSTPTITSPGLIVPSDSVRIPSRPAAAAADPDPTLTCPDGAQTC